MGSVPQSLESRGTKKSWYSTFGPGLITGASDDDPSGIATYSQIGAQFGFGFLWVMLFIYPLQAATQEISARVGRVTGHGVSGNLRRAYHPSLLYGITAVILTVTIITLGADIGAMGAAVHLLIGGPSLLYATGFAVLSAVLQIFVPYTTYARFLKVLTLALFAYVITVFLIHVPWGAALRATIWPQVQFSGPWGQGLVAVVGTTISPYLFFWQAAEEVSELDAHPLENPLIEQPAQAQEQFHRIRVDTYTGMAFANAVAFCIILTAAVTLHAHGIKDIQTAAQAAQALQPIAGRFAFFLFAMGILGTGLLAVPVMAGTAGYTLGEALNWPTGLERKPLQARGFYAIIAVATLLGLGMNFFHLDPIRALYYSAIVNGLASTPIMLLLMLVASNTKIMGRFVIPRYLRSIGWLATAIMAIISAIFFITLGRS